MCRAPWQGRRRAQRATLGRTATPRVRAVAPWPVRRVCFPTQCYTYISFVDSSALWIWNDASAASDAPLTTVKFFVSPNHPALMDQLFPFSGLNSENKVLFKQAKYLSSYSSFNLLI